MTLAMTNQELRERVARFLGYPAVENLSASQREVVDQAVADGKRRFYWPPAIGRERYPHRWSFLLPVVTLTTESGRWVYDLPDDFSAIEGPLTYAPEASVLYPPIEITAAHVLEYRRQRQSVSGRPTAAAVQVAPLDPSVGTRWQLLLDPQPDAAYTLRYRYRVDPQQWGENQAFGFGGPPHTQTLLEACLAAAEKNVHDEQGVHEQNFLECLAASVGHDRKAASPDTLGLNVDRSDVPLDPLANWRDYSFQAVTYKGQVW